MDVDEPRTVPYIEYFKDGAAQVFQEPIVEQIRARRIAMRHSLLFDDLLTSGGISKPNILYPPEGETGLEALLEAIGNSKYDTLKKDCLIYYLLKWQSSGKEDDFQKERNIPPQFAALSDAYWHIDSGIQISKAVALLSDARLNRDYASKIIQALSIAPDGPALVRTYVQTAKPLLVDHNDINCYSQALAESSVLESWQFQRTFGETDELHGALFRSLLEWTVTPRPRPAALTQLMALPLSPFEESVLNEFVKSPLRPIEFSAIAILQDLICVRLIQGGRYSEAIKLDRLFTSKTLPRDLHATKARSEMVHDIYTALPSIERAVIDSELDPLVVQKTPLTPKPPTSVRRQPAASASEAENLSLSQSWEHVQMPGQLSTPLKDVRVPPKPMSFGASPLHASTSAPTGSVQPLPVLPIDFAGVGSSKPTSTPLKNMSVGPKPRTSLSGVGARMAFSNMMVSPASGAKVPPALAPAPHSGRPATTTATAAFVSASRQQNAFYQPPPAKTNGVKRAFVEDEARSSEQPENGADITMADDNVGDDAEPERQAGDKAMAETSGDDLRRSQNGHATRPQQEEETPLDYSLFRGSQEPESEPITYQPTKPSTRKSPAPKISASTSSNKKRAAPPGSYLSDIDDAMDESHDELVPARPTRSARSSKTTRAASQEPPLPSVVITSASATSSKPPAAKKPRQTKEHKIQDFSRSIPGGLMDDEQDEDDEDEEVVMEDEEHDVIAPLRQRKRRPVTPPPAAPPARARGVKKSRSSLSVASDDMESGPQTRRRSSRLTGGGGSGSVNGGSVHGGSPEPQPVSKTTRKGTRTAGATKKAKK